MPSVGWHYRDLTISHKLRMLKHTFLKITQADVMNIGEFP